MNKVTRKSVFETNSSSTHSITIAEGRYKPDRLPIDENGVITLEQGEFGWEVNDYCDARTKASYCLQYLLGYTTQYTHEDIESTRQKILDLELRYEWEMLKEAIKEVTNCKDVVAAMGSGYIDHQSQDVCEEVFRNKQSLKDFIFNPKSVLHTDNDNH